MPDPTPTPQGSTILTAPPPAALPTPEAMLFKTTPTSEPSATPPAPATPPVTEAPVTPPAASEPPKPPTEPTKTEATTTPPPAPTEIDLKLSPDSVLTPEDLAQTVKEAKESGMTQEEASEMLTLKDQTARAAQTRLKADQEKAFETTKSQWKEAVSKDPEMGGEHLAETVSLSSRAFKTLASPELQVWAEKTGLGSYPEFVRLMAKVGRMMAEDKFVRGTNGEPPRDFSTTEAKAELLYGKTTPNK